MNKHLTDQEVRELLLQIREGDGRRRALSKLVEDKKGIVFKAIQSMRSRFGHVPYDDLLQEGYVGMIQAILRFARNKDFDRPKFGAQFGAYLRSAIKSHIPKAIDREYNLINHHGYQPRLWGVIRDMLTQGATPEEIDKALAEQGFRRGKGSVPIRVLIQTAFAPDSLEQFYPTEDKCSPEEDEGD